MHTTTKNNRDKVELSTIEKVIQAYCKISNYIGHMLMF